VLVLLYVIKGFEKLFVSCMHVSAHVCMCNTCVYHDLSFVYVSVRVCVCVHANDEKYHAVGVVWCNLFTKGIHLMLGDHKD